MLNKIYTQLKTVFSRTVPIRLICNSKNGFVMEFFLSPQWSQDGSTSFESIGLLITSCVDRNHQTHPRTITQSETLLFAAHESLCVDENKNMERTGIVFGQF